ncbi:ATPase [Spirochaetia bacterium]|nr:ATPase [Spirochaetia bacterium]
MAVKERIKALLEQLNKGIYEKEEVMALALLSSIAGESIFLLGPPGVAKSLIARRLKYAYKDGTVFEYLMSRFSTPDEIFGPVSISKLKDEDKYERITKNYLPSSSVIFLDEIWKAGPSIQNALLTVLNEKIFRNGEKEIQVPMKALISASNELPAKDEGLEALWDRFLVRLIVEGITDRERFDAMISMPSAPFDDKEIDKIIDPDKRITDEEYEAWSKAIDTITIPENIFNVIDVIRKEIAQHNEKEENAENQIYVSDRRWRKIVRLLRTSAFLNDRKEVDLMDCILIKDCVWNEKAQIGTIFWAFSDAIVKHGYTVSFDFKGIKDELTAFQTEINEETKFVKDTRVEVLTNARKDYYEINAQIDGHNLLITQNEFKNLTNANQQMYLYYWHTSYQSVQQYSAYNIRKGNSKFSIFINDTEFKLKTATQGEKRQATRKPHPKVEEDWDERTARFLQHTGDMKSRIEEYRNKDLEHLRTNLFVKPEWANFVESHITETLKDIEKLELEIREIQNGYKKLKDEEVVVK